MQAMPLKPAELFFLFVLTGSMLFEMTHFTLLSDLSQYIFPQKLSILVESNSAVLNNLLKVGWLFFFFPMMAWILPYFLMKSVGVTMSAADYVRKISLAFVPVIAFFFVGLSIMEIATKIPYFPYIIRDIRGVETVKLILFRQIEAPQLPGWTNLFFFILLMILMFTGIFFSFRVLQNNNFRNDRQSSGMLAFTLPFLFMLLIMAGCILFPGF